MAQTDLVGQGFGQPDLHNLSCFQRAVSAVSAETIAKALGGRKIGSGWIACCPAHDDQDPSLSIRDANGKTLVRCHAGCDQERLITCLRALGLWSGNRRRPLGRLAQREVAKAQWTSDETARTRAALTIWESARSADSSLVETYFAARGLHLPPSPTLRFHAGLKHPSGGVWPAMVALVTRGTDGVPVAVHRTFLSRDGAGKAPVNPCKMMLGPCRGGAVRLEDPTGVLMIGEGLESCAAAMQASGHPAWAALSTSGMRALDLPEDARNVIVLADGDSAGEAAAHACAARWARQGRRVSIARPPHGLDFNDVLLGHAFRTEKGGR